MKMAQNYAEFFIKVKEVNIFTKCSKCSKFSLTYLIKVQRFLIALFQLSFTEMHSLFFGDKSDLNTICRYWLSRVYLNSGEQGLIITEYAPLRLKFDAHGCIVKPCLFLCVSHPIQLL